MANPDGTVAESCASLPFGDELICSGSDPSAHHFTGQLHDQETGNDYFGARYYSNSTGRWVSPDPINLTNDRLLTPANTLNKYVYGANDPLKYVDKDGKDITVFYRHPNGDLLDFGHVFLGVLNQDTGKTGFLDFCPMKGTTNGAGIGVGIFNPGDENERATDYANGKILSLTIQTNPEQAQADRRH